MGAGSDLPRGTPRKDSSGPTGAGTAPPPVAFVSMPSPACRHVVLTCMDFRFVEPLHRFLEAEGIAGDEDLLSWPGGAACLSLADERERALDALALARKLHGCERVLLVTHEDCMRLGGSAMYADDLAERDALAAHLRRAAGEVRASIPDLEPRAFVLLRSGDVVEIGV